MRNLTRRKFLVTGLAGVGGAAVGYGAWDYATDSPVRARVVIVGGGAAGVTVAARLQKLLRNPDITLIEPEAVHHYQPGYTLIAAGEFAPDEIIMPEAELIPSRVKWIQDRVREVKPDQNRVRTEKMGTVDYDFLVLTPGCQVNFDRVEGIRRRELGKGNAHCIYDYEGSIRCRQALETAGSDGEGSYIFTDTYTKLKCGGAPKKICMIAEDRFREAGIRERFQFRYYSNSTNLMTPKVFGDQLAEHYRERDIETRFLHRLKGIDTDRKEAHFEIIPEATLAPSPPDSGFPVVKVAYDFLHFVPPMSAPDFIRESSLSITEGELRHGGWIDVDAATLFHRRYGNIIALGDAAGLPTSKTGAAIRMQAPVAAANLVARMEDKEPEKTYNGYSACPIITEKGKVLMAEFKYGKELDPTIPLLNPAVDRSMWWILKRHGLKPMYFHGMLRGRM